MANHVARRVRQMHKLRYFIIIVPNSAWREKRALQSEERSFPSLTAIISTNQHSVYATRYARVCERTPEWGIHPKHSKSAGEARTDVLPRT
jgi:hypothetical protein